MAEVPRAPDDLELRKIIDKLAQFVARNGPDFEQMTKQKQKENPKFAFLYGGEHFLYYQYKVTAEQAIMKKQKGGGSSAGLPPPQQWPAVPSGGQSVMTSGPPAAGGPASQNQSQIQSLEAQLQDSDKNLKAQHEVLMQQQQSQIDVAIAKAEMDRVMNLAGTCDLNLDEFGHILDALALSCTKEAIANGKQWIFNNAQSDRHREIVLLYLLRRIKETSATPDARLHILYLINDWAHHCMRKKLDPVTQLLQRYVSQMYCYCYKYATDPGSQEKLAKLLALWENHQYFTDNIYKQMQDPKQTLVQFQSASLAEHSGLVNEITQRFQSTYANYQQQHNEFAKHVQQQIQALQTAQQLAQNIQQQQASQQQPKRKSRFDNPEPMQKQPPQQPPPSQPQPPTVPPITTEAHPVIPPMRPPGGQNLNQRPPFGYAVPPHPQTQQPPRFPPEPSVPQQWPPPHSGPPPVFGNPPPRGMPPFPPPRSSGGPWPGWPPMRGAPPGVGPPMPLSGTPPRSLIPPAEQKEDKKPAPTVMYYDLPAGLMVPLVGLEDCDYKPLDPKQMRLPPPMPPSERLVAAVEAFYAPPTHENPRDSEGWEKLGLYEFYKAKSKATQDKKEKAESKSAGSSRSGSGSRSRSKSKSRSRSLTPPKNAPTRSRSESGSGSRSSSRSQSRSPPPRKNRARKDRRSRSHSGSPDTSEYHIEGSERLDEDNKGHQLMTKMGWSGGGLGLEEQGRREPVEGGEVRDRMDLYKGIGAGVDPFEMYRRQKSGHYVQRIIQAQKDREDKVSD